MSALPTRQGAARNRQEFRSALNEPCDSEILDPTAAAIGGTAAPLDYPKNAVLAVTPPRATDAHYVFDIESWRLNPGLLHIAALGSIDADPSTYAILRHWDDVHDAIVQIAMTMHDRADPDLDSGVVRVKIWAHNGSKFDWLGLANYLQLTPSNHFEHSYKPDAGHYTRCTVKPVRYGNRELIEYSFKTTSYKNRRREKSTVCRIQLVDSLWHLQTSLRKLGSKTATPEQYTNPLKWVRETFPDDADIPPRLLWQEYVDPDAVEYCKNDIKVLADALKTYRDTVRGLYHFDPLDYLTAPKVALAAVVASYPTAGAAQLPSGVLVNSGAGWYVAPAAPADAVEVDRPFYALPHNTSAIYCKSGWYCSGAVADLYRRITFGGRCEVFAPRNKPGTRMLIIDAASMYPSRQSIERYIDPRRISELLGEVRGRDAILRMLETQSGMFLIETMPSLDPITKKYPIFPMRTTGSIPEDRLLFAGWSGKIRLLVTGEELRYFLQRGPVENDDVAILPHGSYRAPLLPAADTPQVQFVRRLYGERRKAKNEIRRLEALIPTAAPELVEQYAQEIAAHTGRAEMLKILLNAGGYGVLVQKNGAAMIVPADHGAAIDAALTAIAESDPLYEHDESKHGIDRVIDYFVQNYLEYSYHYDEAGTRIYRFSLPDSSAQHAIVPWGAQITAYARVDLHKTIAAAHGAGYQVCYCDTDSVHLAVPDSMTDGEVMTSLSAAGINIGNDLGCWDHESEKAERHLSDCDADLDVNGNINSAQGYYLGPKNYHHTDRRGNILHSVMKGIGRTHPSMRSALYSFGIQLPRLAAAGSTLNIGVPAERDALPGIGARPKRNFDDYSSTPLQFQHTLPAGESWIEYMRRYGNNVGRCDGIKNALEAYRHCKINGVDVDETRIKLQRGHAHARRQAVTAAERGQSPDFESTLELIDWDYLGEDAD